MSALLPDGFAALEPFAENWAIEGADNRDKLRCFTDAEARAAFHAAMADHVARALDQLDATPLAQHSAAEHRLMLLALAYAHAAPSVVTLDAAAEAKHAVHRRRLPITRAPSDL